MTKIFLIGGGWCVETFPETYGRFLESAAKSGERRIAIIVAEEDGADSHAQFLRFFEALESVGLTSAEAFEIIVSAKKPLILEDLNQINPTGIFVCGGLIPAYADALCADKSWLDFVNENTIPFCGFSAGAAIAAKNAIIGGWQREIGEKTIQIADENAAEDLDLLEIREGLGLVNFAVEVHATQWGTLSRLVHAVDSEKTIEGFAIDENTMLEIDGENFKIFGAGCVYRVEKENGAIKIEIFQSANLR